MKKKILCILCGMLVAIIFALPSRADTIPFISTPPPTPTITSSVPSRTGMTPVTGIHISSPPVMTCDGASRIIFDTIHPSAAQNTTEIQRYLNEYRSYESGGAYKLCFEIEAANINAGLIFNFTTDKPVLISGLKILRKNDLLIPKDFDLFTINTTFPVTLIDSDIQGIGAMDEGTCLVSQGPAQTLKNVRVHGCHDGIRAEGTGALIESSEISDSPEGACLLLRGSGTVVKSSRFFDCDKGVFIESSNNFLGASNEVTFDAERNEIFNNRTAGIFWSSGTGNRFPFNSIYHNGNAFLPDDTIQINPDLGISRPELIILSSEDKNVLHCDKDPTTGSITARWLKLRNIIEGEVLLYETFNINERQPYNYILKCVPDSDGKCILPSSSRFTWPPSECGTNIPVVALINNPNFTTRASNDGRLIGAFITFIATGPTIDIPTSSQELDDTTETTSSDQMSAEGAGSGEGGGASVVSAGPGSGGCGGGGGATIVPPNHHTIGSGLILWWLIFTAPAVLIAVRIKKRK